MSLSTCIACALLLASPEIAAADDGGQPSMPNGLETALARDLQLSPSEFAARGDLADAAAEALPRLKQIDGFAGIRVSGNHPARLIITGTGTKLEHAAEELNATLVAPESAPDSESPRPSATAAPPPEASTTPATKAPTSEPVAATPTASPSGTSPPTPAAPETDKAESSPEAVASATELLKNYVDTYGDAGLSRLQSIMQNSDGNYVIRMKSPQPRLRAAHDASGPSSSSAPSSAPAPSGTSAPAPEAFASDFVNVNIATAEGPADPLIGQSSSPPADPPTGTSSDTPDGPPTGTPSDPPDGPHTSPIVGGLGTMTENADYVSVCSMGFNAYSPSGEPAAISAGHCTMDGQFREVSLTNPTSDRASKPGASDPQAPLQLQRPERQTELGKYGFSQFGGPGNTSGTEEPATNVGTDVAVIEDIDDKLDQLPAVTNWKTPSDPAASGPMVRGTTTPIIGVPVCKSGRTTGWTCGGIKEVGIFVVAGSDYATDRSDVRVIKGFGSHDLYSATGDSGGPMITGNHALGVLSAGGGSGQGSKTTFGAGIGPMLKTTGGYTLQLFVPAPQLHDDGGTIRPGDLIRGSAAAGAEVNVTSGREPLNVKVSAGGQWSFRAPEETGVFEFSITASKGFSTSEPGKYRLIVKDKDSPSPGQDESTPGKDGSAPGKNGSKPDSAKSQPDHEVVPAGGKSPQELADTGAATGPLLIGEVAMALLAAGTLLLLAVRRRRF